MKDPKEITIESYNKTAEEYARNVAGAYFKEGAEKFLSYLSKEGLILDLGCGSGRDARIFTEKGYNVVGVDLSDELLEIARKDAPKADFKLMDIINLNFPNDYFNGVWAMASLLHVPKKDISKTIKGVYKVLKPGGVFYAVNKGGIGESFEPDELYGGVKKIWSFFKRGELEPILENSGFTILDVINFTQQRAGSDKDIGEDDTPHRINILCKK